MRWPTAPPSRPRRRPKRPTRMLRARVARPQPERQRILHGALEPRPALVLVEQDGRGIDPRLDGVLADDAVAEGVDGRDLRAEELPPRALPARPFRRAGARTASAVRSSRILVFISAAAFSVNVIARISLTCSTGGECPSSPRSRCRKCSERTRVLPAPAPARTAAEPTTRIAARCSGVGPRSAILDLFLFQGRLLVAADAAEGAVRVARLGVDVEPSRARPRDELGQASEDRRALAAAGRCRGARA